MLCSLLIAPRDEGALSVAILDVIEWVDQGGNEIVHRVPEYGSGEFRLGSQCIVRDSQAVNRRTRKDQQVCERNGHARCPATVGKLDRPTPDLR